MLTITREQAEEAVDAVITSDVLAYGASYAMLDSVRTVAVDRVMHRSFTPIIRFSDGKLRDMSWLTNRIASAAVRLITQRAKACFPEVTNAHA